jgi:PHP family Zn ribbon phosphoesterase
VAGPASLSSLEELTTGMMRRTRRRPPLDRQVPFTEMLMKGNLLS